MSNLTIKKNITTLELLEQINYFRSTMDGKSELRHDTLLNIIRDEFEEEISLQKLLESKYTNSRGKQYPMFNLTLSQAKQVLVRESKHVRRAVIKYIEELENQLQNIQPKYKKLYYKQQPVMTIKMLSELIGVPSATINYHTSNIKALKGKELKDFKAENSLASGVSSLRILTKYNCLRLLSVLGLDRFKTRIIEYFKENKVIKTNEIKPKDNYYDIINSSLDLMDILLSLTLEDVFEVEKNYFSNYSNVKTNKIMLDIFQRAKLRLMS